MLYVKFVRTGSMVSEEMSFENVDDGRLPYYKLSYEASAQVS